MKKKILILFVISLFFIAGCGKKEETKKVTKKKEETKEIQIIDMNSNTRPYAVVINNFPGAIKVQSGLQKAYIVYEFPIEGGMTRSLALFKDVEEAKIGTIRSARQNYVDYALENDAIYVHFGWNHPAEDKAKTAGADYINGLFDNTFYRENPEKLDSEHTVYADLSKLIAYSKDKKGFRTTTEVKPPIEYSTDEINLTDGISAKNVEIPYSSYYKLTYKYNEETKVYERYANDTKHTDYFTKEDFTTKNIILVKVNTGEIGEYQDAAGTNYLDIKNIGSGDGYYITNGFAKEITWTKKDVSSQTEYKYKDGTKIKVNDGNTYITFQPNNITSTIN